MIRTIIPVVLLCLATPLAMAFINVPTSKLYRDRHVLDAISALVMMTPFYIGMSYLFKERLRFGRQYVAEGNWKAAVAALEPFDSFTQRFQDSTGEAHYLLVQAYSAAGNKAKAEKARTFLVQHRSGPWADKLKSTEPPRVSALKAAKAAEQTTPERQDASQPAAQHDKFSKPTSRPERSRSSAPKRKRRF